MANIKSAKKRARQNAERRLHNRGLRSTVRTQIKNVYKAVAAGDRARAEEAYRQAVPVIDRVAGKGIIHKNKAARHKSHLSARIRAMQG